MIHTILKYLLMFFLYSLDIQRFVVLYKKTHLFSLLSYQRVWLLFILPFYEILFFNTLFLVLHCTIFIYVHVVISIIEIYLIRVFSDVTNVTYCFILD